MVLRVSWDGYGMHRICVTGLVNVQTEWSFFCFGIEYTFRQLFSTVEGFQKPHVSAFPFSRLQSRAPGATYRAWGP